MTNVFDETRVLLHLWRLKHMDMTVVAKLVDANPEKALEIVATAVDSLSAVVKMAQDDQKVRDFVIDVLKKNLPEPK